MKTFLAFVLFMMIATGSSSQQLDFGILAGAHISSFTGPYPGDAVGSGKVGLSLSRSFKSNFMVAGTLGLTNDNAKLNVTPAQAQSRWAYYWADLSSLLFYAPIRKNNFSISLGSGVSVRRIVDYNVKAPYLANSTLREKLYPWTYFLPLRLRFTIQIAERHAISASLTSEWQLRALYEDPSPNFVEYNDYIGRFKSFGMLIEYSVHLKKS